MRYLPLGSPTADPNVSYVHVPRVPEDVACTVLVDVRAGWVPGVVPGWVYREGAIPGKYQPGRYIGIARAQPVPGAGCLRPPRHSGPPWALRTPGLLALTQYPPAAKYGRDSVNNILKLVNYPECHHNSVMRPAIVPVSKRPPKSTTLNFPDFHNH